MSSLKIHKQDISPFSIQTKITRYETVPVTNEQHNNAHAAGVSNNFCIHDFSMEQK